MKHTFSQQQVRPPRHLYLLIWQFKDGVEVIPFWYEPNKDFPYPKTEAIIRGLKLQKLIDIPGGDVVRLQEIPPKRIATGANWRQGFGSNRDPDIIMKALDEAEADCEAELEESTK